MKASGSMKEKKVIVSDFTKGKIINNDKKKEEQGKVAVSITKSLNKIDK